MEEFALTFTQAAAHFLWAGAAVALIVFLLDRLFVRSAAVRHGLYLAGMLAMAAGLALCFVAARADSAEPVMGVGTDPGLGQVREVPDERWELSESGALPIVFVEGVEAEARTEKTARQSVSQKSVPDRWQAAAPWVVGIYFTGLSLMIFRLGSGWIAGARLRRRSEPVREGVWMVSVRRAGEAIGLRVLPALRWSQEVAVPAVVGFAKPAILLPVALASRLSMEQVEAVLAHELAHLRRRDLWAVAVQRAVETVLFFHPAVWWMSRVMERSREEACDDLVVAAGSDPADYAEALLICSELRLERAGVSGRLGWHLAATGGNEAPLRERVLRLLGQEKGGSVRLGRAGWVLAAFIIGGIVLALVARNAGREDLSDFDDSSTEKHETDVERFVQQEISLDEAVESIARLGPAVAPEMLPLMRSGKTDRLAVKVLERHQTDAAVQDLLVRTLREAQADPQRMRNTVHCSLLALGGSGNPSHADLIADFLGSVDIAAIVALEKLGGARAREHLIEAFNIVPTNRWHLLAASLERLGDPAAVPELKRRLREVELPPSERFPNATVAAFTNAIATLSGEERTMTPTRMGTDF